MAMIAPLAPISHEKIDIVVKKDPLIEIFPLPQRNDLHKRIQLVASHKKVEIFFWNKGYPFSKVRSKICVLMFRMPR